MEIVDKLVSNALNDNPYFSAGAGLAGVGLALGFLKRTSQLSALIFRRNFTLTLEVASHDKAYPWVLSWVTEKARANQSAKLFSFRSGAGQHISVDTNFVRSDSGKITTAFEFIPSTGIHYLFHNNRIIEVERARNTQSLQGSNVAPFESVTLRTLGRDPHFLSTLLEEARAKALAREEGWTIIYKAVGVEWRQFGYPRRKRPIDSVVLPHGVSESLVDDLRDFLENQEWYTKRGIPYRRGYLLHGPPGCGKSSFISAIAGHFDLSICVLSLSEPGMSSDRLDYLLTHAPMQSIVVLEDVDVAVPSRETDIPTNAPPGTHPSAMEGLRNLTMSGLLNALDGVASTEGRVLFMTTNYLDRLDPALIRPGRVDRAVCVHLCVGEQIRRLFNRFYPPLDGDSEHPKAAQFAAQIGDGLASAAQIQGYLLMHKERPDSAIKDADAFAQALRSIQANS